MDYITIQTSYMCYYYKEDVLQMVLALIFLLVTLLAIVSVIRQLKIKNLFALGFSAVTVLVFGFFSVATIITELGNM